MAASGADESQESITMVEVLQEEQRLEEDANAVLGGSDAKICTYPQGNVPRQALYACVTCTTADKDPAGVCLACSLECHEGHDLYELYTKRNFCCDCGNSKFGDRRCKLWPDKKSLNDDNHYNQNYQGLYCTCHRPYPDPEDEVEDEMIQCVLCEDWFHGGHLKKPVPEGHNFEEMTCYLCVERCPFLLFYQHLQALSDQGSLTKIQTEESTENLNVCPPKEDNTSTLSLQTGTGSEKSENEHPHPGKDSAVSDTKNTECSENKTDDTKTQETDTIDACTDKKKDEALSEDSKKEEEVTTSTCILRQLQDSASAVADGKSIFWKKGWRKQLCSCSSCTGIYLDKSITFITDESDTITSYEEHGRAQSGSQYEKGMEALSQMDRVQQVEMIHGYNDLKTELKDYLRKFAENGKVVKEEDIREFFKTLASRKRQRTDMSYFCK